MRYAFLALTAIVLGCDQPTAPVPAATIASNQSASIQFSSINDPAGDAFFTPGLEAPAELDLLSTSFSISSVLTFTIDVAGPLGSLPDPPGSHGVLFWGLQLDTDRSTFPPGFPFDPAAPLPPEFIAAAWWDGTSFIGMFIDRRPALTGGQILSYSIPITVSGSRITLTVPAQLAAVVQPLPGACWWPKTGWWNTALLAKGTDAIHFADGVIGCEPWPN
jgi:hypothetical protein